MRCLPYAVSMRIAEGERTKFRLWFPVVILWPLLLALLLLTLAATLFADAVTLLSRGKAGYTRLLFGCLGVVGETPGTEVFVQDKSNKNRTVAFTIR